MTLEQIAQMEAAARAAMTTEWYQSDQSPQEIYFEDGEGTHLAFVCYEDGQPFREVARHIVASQPKSVLALIESHREAVRLLGILVPTCDECGATGYIGRDDTPCPMCTPACDFLDALEAK